MAGCCKHARATHTLVYTADCVRRSSAWHQTAADGQLTSAACCVYTMRLLPSAHMSMGLLAAQTLMGLHCFSSTREDTCLLRVL